MDDPRHTQNVDFVVMQRHLAAATRAIQSAYPKLEVEDHEVVVRFRSPESKKVVIDLIKQSSLFREAFKHVEERKQGRQRFLIPTVEMALAMKFAAMLRPNREDKDRYQDAHGFINVIHHNQELDEGSLASLGELVFGGGGKRLLGLVADVRAGRRFTI